MDKKQTVDYIVCMGHVRIRMFCGHCKLIVWTAFKPIVKNRKMPVVHYCQKDFKRLELNDGSRIMFFPSGMDCLSDLFMVN
ncbi:hypothetical protein LCGC14_1214810 [marine sediment metagenome]|uniref:Uncharacterized protein n=1 Tax=marine sediment metagenome TaxID=412755 RepID=A0A0F9M0H3_9ZZZZ